MLRFSSYGITQKMKNKICFDSSIEEHRRLYSVEVKND